MERSLAVRSLAETQESHGATEATPHLREAPVQRRAELGTSGEHQWPPLSMPTREGEEFLRELRDVLEEAREKRRNWPGANLCAAQALIDGALLSARTELLCGGGEQLRVEIPNFVYLVALTLAGQREAERAQAEASRRFAGPRATPQDP